jgi:hypothetical protein
MKKRKYEWNHAGKRCNTGPKMCPAGSLAPIGKTTHTGTSKFPGSPPAGGFSRFAACSGLPAGGRGNPVGPPDPPDPEGSRGLRDPPRAPPRCLAPLLGSARGRPRQAACASRRLPRRPLPLRAAMPHRRTRTQAHPDTGGGRHAPPAHTDARAGGRGEEPPRSSSASATARPTLRPARPTRR